VIAAACGGGQDVASTSTTTAPSTTSTAAPTTTVTPSTTAAPAWRTLFSDGFGPGVEAVHVDSQFGDLRGSDGAAPGIDDWEADLEGNGRTGEFRMYVEDGGLDQTLYSLRPDPADPSNTVLEMHLDTPNVTHADKGRVQAVLRGNPDLREFSYEVKVRLEEGFEPLLQRRGRITWLTLAEFWNDLPGTGRGFRVTLNVIKDEAAVGTPLTWHVHGQEKIGDGWSNETGHGWSHVARGVPVPLGEWVTLRARLRDGDETSGLVQIDMVDGSGRAWTIVDVQDRTRHPDAAPDGFTDINPMKLYTSGQLLRGLDQVGQDLVVLWDDFTLSVPNG